MSCYYDLAANCWIPPEDADPSSSVSIEHMTVLPDGPTPDESTWDAITEEKQAQFYREPNEAQGRPRGMPPAPLTYKRGWTYSKWRSFYLKSQTQQGRLPKKFDAGHIESLEEIASDQLFDKLGPAYRRVDHRDWWNYENMPELEQELEEAGTTQVTTDIDGDYVSYIFSDPDDPSWTDHQWEHHFAETLGVVQRSPYFPSLDQWEVKAELEFNNQADFRPRICPHGRVEFLDETCHPCTEEDFPANDFEFSFHPAFLLKEEGQGQIDRYNIHPANGHDSDGQPYWAVRDLYIRDGIG